MTKEALCTKTVGIVERLLDEPFFTRSTWAVIILAALYFGAGFVMSGLIQGIFSAWAR